MSKKKHREEEPENQERWLLTYADLITLLLGLFVILYAMSQVDKTKYQDFVSALTQQFGSKSVLAGHKGISFDPSTKTGRAQSPKFAFKRVPRKERISSQLSILLKKQIESNQVMIKDTKDGIAINLLELLMFETGKADIRPQAEETLDAIADFLSQMNNRIRVEGHTDNIPIHTAVFPSNWHLSVARAMNTGYSLMEKGVPQQRISIAGYSEFQPVAENDSPENRAKNRRVEIVIITESSRTGSEISFGDSL
jgi:chemotaxis protein MotB